MLKFQSKFCQSTKISCEWEIDASIFKSGENPKLQTKPTSVPDMPGLKWWLTARPYDLGWMSDHLSIYLCTETDSAVHASFSFKIKGTDYKKTKEHHKFEAGVNGKPCVFSRDKLLKNSDKYFKNGKLTIIFEGELYGPSDIQTVKIKK